MTKQVLTRIEVNCETGQTTEHILTAEEEAQRDAEVAAFQARQDAMETDKQALAALKSSAKANLVAGLPLTPEEADTLIL